ncbi:MAG TPA: SLC13 family permease [Xanthomonadales bacterium]|nr:SLC13 family permease [Xanthomonadales bacterium]
MGFDAWFTLALVAITLAVLIGSHLAPELVLVGALTVLILAGVLSPEQALSGLANPGLVTVGVLYVVVAGLVDTGAVHALGARLLGRPRSVASAQFRLMLPVTAISAFLNNTPVVAMLIPVVEDWARRCGISPSKLMMPLSYAAILGGTCTLIGTSTNLIVQGMVSSSTDLPAMGFFEIGALGLPSAAVGILIIMLAGRWLLPERKPPLRVQDDAREYAIEMLVESGSPLVGRTVESAGLRHLPGAFLAEIERGGTLLPAVSSAEVLRAEDRLVFIGVVDSVIDILRLRGLIPAPDQLYKLDEPRADRRLFEVVVSDSSPVIGRNIRDSRFRSRYDAVVIAVARNGERLSGKVGDITLKAGDILLLETRLSFHKQNQSSRDFLLVSELSHAKLPRHDKAWLAAGILAVMVTAAATGLLSMLEAALVAALLMLASGCTRLDSARATIDWNVLVVIGAALGIGSAMTLTGVADVIAHGWIALAGDNPLLALIAVYTITSLITEVITNNAAAVLILPIALSSAESLGVSPWPFIACIMMAASASFATPLGYQTNLMVYGPGGYRFLDYARMGIVLNVSLGIVAVILAPMIWPF